MFELMYKDGTPAGKVVKIAHKDIGHNLLNRIFIGMERECGSAAICMHLCSTRDFSRPFGGPLGADPAG